MRLTGAAKSSSHGIYRRDPALALHHQLVSPLGAARKSKRSVSCFFFSSRRRHRRCLSDWSSDVCSSDLRQFLKVAVQAGAIIAAPQVVRGGVLGKDGAVPPSEQIRLGAIGIGNRGSYDLGCFLEEPDVRFVAICDVKAERRESVKKRADEKYGNQDCAMYRDLRELLARSDIDAVLIATGPNWHATAAIMTAKAGKDVYCEKPCSKNIAQSLALAETFRRTGRVFQAGTQRRSLPNFDFAIDLAPRGKVGKLETH